MPVVNGRTTAGMPSLRATAQAGMFAFLCVLSFVCINSTSGQYLETTIMLPDSLGGAYGFSFVVMADCHIADGKKKLNRLCWWKVG